MHYCVLGPFGFFLVRHLVFIVYVFVFFSYGPFGALLRHLVRWKKEGEATPQTQRDGPRHRCSHGMREELFLLAGRTGVISLLLGSRKAP